MDNQENSTIGIRKEDFGGFTKVTTSSVEATSKPLVDDDNKSIQHKPAEGGWGVFPRHLMGAIKEDFPTSIFVLILLGYVIIETFGKDGINFDEYIKFIFILFVVYGLFRATGKADLFENVVSFLNKKKIFIGVVLIVIIDSVFNHWPFIQWVLSSVAEIFKSKP